VGRALIVPVPVFVSLAVGQMAPDAASCEVLVSATEKEPAALAVGSMRN
jgi:hypothetical protein